MTATGQVKEMKEAIWQWEMVNFQVTSGQMNQERQPRTSCGSEIHPIQSSHWSRILHASILECPWVKWLCHPQQNNNSDKITPWILWLIQVNWAVSFPEETASLTGDGTYVSLEIYLFIFYCRYATQREKLTKICIMFIFSPTHIISWAYILGKEA